MRNIESDNLVIGSGPGGAVTAYKLAQAGHQVLLVEEGQKRSLAPLHSVDEMLNDYRSGGVSVALGNPPVAYVEGRCWGGGSEVNAGLYHRLPEEIRSRWESGWKIPGLDKLYVERIFSEIEENLQITKPVSHVSKSSERLCIGAKQLGWKAVEALRCSLQNGAMLERQTMSNTYLQRAEKLGCRSLRGVRVQKLLLNSSRAVAAIGKDQLSHEPVTIYFKSVFVCCGPVMTPFLLQKSGLGRNFGSQIGVHPWARITALFQEDVQAEGDLIGSHQVREFAPDFTFGCSVSSRPFLAASLANYPSALKDLDKNWKKMACYFVTTSGHGRGSVVAFPGLDNPVVKYQLAENDVQLLKEGLVKLGHLLFAAGAKQLFPSVTGAPAVSRPDDLTMWQDQIVRDRLSVTTAHLFSSCSRYKIGRCAPLIDHWGKLLHFKNMYLNDASILPDSPGVNPQGTIMMMAQRNIEHALTEF